ncbi:MAG: DUF4339 domain-containing protein [Phycisphaeraceae bacterium]
MIGILAAFVFGAVCGAIANSKGRNVGGWLVLGGAAGLLGGICFGWIPVLIVATLPNLHDERERQLQQQRENRRLREELRQERAKNEGFREHVTHRLDAHDQVLELDTRQTPHAQLEAGPEPRNQLAGEGAEEGAGEPWESQAWWYAANDKTVGPISGAELKELFKIGLLDGETLVCNDRRETWTPAVECSELKPLVQS